MGKENNLHDYLSDLADAIREKKGTTDPINAQDFSEEIRSIAAGGSGWTGHADVEGLKAIGWTDEDIAYYQKYGVNWNEEEDEYHKVSDDNKALYGVLTINNISEYAERIVYLPKINTSSSTTLSDKFYGCYSMVAIPMLDTSKVTIMRGAFYYCYSLVTIPPLDTSKVTTMSSMFYSCYSLTHIPQLDTSNVTDMSSMFYYCYSLTDIPQIDMSKVTTTSSMFNNCRSLVSVKSLNTSNVATAGSMFSNCYALVSIPQLDTSKTTNINSIFTNCYSLKIANIKNIKLECNILYATHLSKESLLYIINNEAATSAITINLASYAYERLANDVDVVAALAAHPNISISQ